MTIRKIITAVATIAAFSFAGGAQAMGGFGGFDIPTYEFSGEHKVNTKAKNKTCTNGCTKTAKN